MMYNSLRPTLLAVALSFVWPAFCASLLYDDFDGPTMNSSFWYIPTWVSSTDGTFVGQTQFRCSQNCGLPVCLGGEAKIRVNRYNPTGFSYYGDDVISKTTFYPTTGEIAITVRLKVNQVQPGTVFAFFLYAPPASTANTNHNEIDFEFLGNDPTNIHTNLYGGEPLGVGHPQIHSFPSGGAITDYHIYEIRWSATSVKWLVDGVQVRQVTTESPLPTGPMYLHLNAWVPDSSFAQAYSATIPPPVSSAVNDTEWSMNVASVSASNVVQTATTVSVTPSSLDLSAGSTGQLTASCQDQTGAPMVANFTWSSDNQPVATVDQTGKVSAVASGSAQITASAGSASNKVSVTVPVAQQQTVSTPAFSPGGGTFSSAQLVTISCGTLGATIYYTTDGSYPTASSDIYSSAITVTASQTLKALAVKSGMNDSSVATAIFTISTTTPPPDGGGGTSTGGTGGITEGSSEICAGVITTPGKNIRITKCPALNQFGFIAGTATTPVGSNADVVIYVEGGWWSKPAFSVPLTPINKRGKWKARFQTGGVDYAATEVRVYLLPPGATLPLMSGQNTLDPAYNQYEYATVTRAFAIRSIKVRPRKVSLWPGSVYYMTASVVGKNRKPVVYMDSYLVWTSVDNNIATVDQEGVIKAVSPGITQVVITTTADPLVQTVIPVTVK